MFSVVDESVEEGVAVGDRVLVDDAADEITGLVVDCHALEENSLERVFGDIVRAAVDNTSEAELKEGFDIDVEAEVSVAEAAPPMEVLAESATDVGALSMGSHDAVPQLAWETSF